MGMYDDVIIRDDIIEGLPVGWYQTKDLACGLDVYEVTKDKQLVLSKSDSQKQYWGYNYPKYNKSIPINLNGKLNIYSDDIPDKNRIEGLLTIENGVIVSFEETCDEGSDFELDKIQWSYVKTIK